MEVKIRLQRAGQVSSGRYNYRIVAISKSKSRDSKHLEIIGNYDPSKKTQSLVINKEKLEKWIKNGAQMSDTVRSLVKKIK